MNYRLWILGRGSKLGYRNPIKIKPERKEEIRLI